MTTATLRPNGTDSSSGTAITGSATIHGATSDNSDASYVTIDAAMDFFAVNTGTTTIGSGSVAKSIEFQARALDVNGWVPSGPGTCRVRVVRNVDDVLIESAFHPTPTVTLITEGSYLGSLTQADIDSLQIIVDQPDEELRFHELYLRLTYVTLPVVALAAITDPYTASTSISCSWSNTLDSDGGGQTAYQLWVTDDNNSNAIVWDSGIIASSATSRTTGPLTNGGAYTVHVKVAQTVNGSYHWSAEDTQADVDLSVTTVDVSSVTASADNANAKITVTVTRDVADGPWEYVEVERSADGVTWEPVRGSTFVAPTGANTHVVDDFEVPNGTAVDYRARATYYLTGSPVTSAWTETASTTSWSSTSTWFKVPGSPSLNDTFSFKQLPSSSRPMRYGQFAVLGASRPVVVTDARSSPDSRCVVQTSTEAEQDAFLAIMAQPVVLIQTPTSFKRWGSRYCVVRNLDDTPLSGAEQVMTHSGYAVWSFDAIEVDSPGDPDAGAL